MRSFSKSLIAALAVIVITSSCFADPNPEPDPLLLYHAKGGRPYATGVGLRGGFLYGITLKHFFSETGAIEGLLGTGFIGLSVSALTSALTRTVFISIQLPYRNIPEVLLLLVLTRSLDLNTGPGKFHYLSASTSNHFLMW